MAKLASRNKCTGCMTCGDVCNKQAISFEIDSEGFYQYRINSTLCVNCGLCEKICHVLNPIKIENRNYAKYYAAYSMLDNEEFSSSGGVFAAIAKQFILDGGVVVGASIIGVSIKHIIIDKISDLLLIQGSKYLQSNTSGIYKTVRDYLKSGIKVLFSGTSCQLAGLLSYLHDKYDNLYTVDLVCHGVPSYRLINLYEDEIGDEILSIKSFRDKKDGWNSEYALSVTTPNGLIRSKNNIFNDVFKGFLALRKSCYNCSYRSLQRLSDITLGDFWRYNGDLKNNLKGLNMVMVNTDKGMTLLDTTQIKKQEVLVQDILKSNPNIYIKKIFGFRYHPYRLFLSQVFKYGSTEWIHGALSYKNNGLMMKIFHYLLSKDRRKKYEKEISRLNDNLSI